MNLLYKGRTIDTFSTYQTEIGAVKSENGKYDLTNEKPSLVINETNCIDDGMLFNLSNLKSDNEVIEDFKDNTVIDVYRVINNEYLGSFYIPISKKEKMIQFKVYANILVAVSKNSIYIYKIPRQSLDNSYRKR